MRKVTAYVLRTLSPSTEDGVYERMSGNERSAAVGGRVRDWVGRSVL